MTKTILISGGAGYIGSHAAYVLQQAGTKPVIIDNLSTGHAKALRFGAFEQGDIGDTDFVQSVCAKYKPDAVLHFAALIDVGESVQNPAKYFDNNRDQASRFFTTLNACGVKKTVFSSTAAVYGEIGSPTPITEMQATKPINPYGQSKLDAETFLRGLDSAGMRSVTLRYFNVAGAAPMDAAIGEMHNPETHVIPRLVLPLIDTPPDILQSQNLQSGFTIYGNDYPTPDGTAIRDYVHVMDLIAAHIKALEYLLQDGVTDIFNLGSGKGFSVREIVGAVRKSLNRLDFTPSLAPRRAGDPAVLVASSDKADKVLGWKPTRDLSAIINDAIAWHRSMAYRDGIRSRV